MSTCIQCGRELGALPPSAEHKKFCSTVCRGLFHQEQRQRAQDFLSKVQGVHGEWVMNVSAEGMSEALNALASRLPGHFIEGPAVLFFLSEDEAKSMGLKGIYRTSPKVLEAAQ